MTLEEAIKLASWVYSKDMGTAGNARELAKWIVENLAEAAPCGFEEAKALPGCTDGYPVYVPDWHGRVTPEAARALGRMLLAAADEAEAKTTPWVVTSFNDIYKVGVVHRLGVHYSFHSTSFHCDSGFRWPRVGEEVEVAFNNSGSLLSVIGK